MNILKKVLIIYNPVAGWMPSKSLLFDLIEKLRNDDYITTVFMTRKDKSLDEYLKDNPDFDLLICCGGDGTLHSVINSIIKLDLSIPLGYIPIGTTNDFGTAHGIPHDFNQAYSIINQKKERALDAGLFNFSEYFTYIACFGIFTRSTYQASQPLKNSLGQFAYLLEGSKDIGNFDKAYPMRVIVDNKEYSGNFLFGAVINSLNFAGFFTLPITYDHLDDNQMEVLLIKAPENLIQFQNVAGSMITNDFNSENILFIKGRSITFIAEEPVAWNLDGEYAGKTRIAQITVKNKAIRLILAE